MSAVTEKNEQESQPPLAAGDQPQKAEGEQPPKADEGEMPQKSGRDSQRAQSSSRGPRAPKKQGGLSQELRERVKEKYQPSIVGVMVRYNRLGSQFAEFANNVAFLSRCSSMSMVPKSHRVYSENVRNTRVIVRILDQCSYKLMMADLDYCRQRRHQVRRNRERIENRLKQVMSPEDFEEVFKICEDNKEKRFGDIKERQRQEFEELMNEYKANDNRRGTTRRADNQSRGGRSRSSQNRDHTPNGNEPQGDQSAPEVTQESDESPKKEPKATKAKSDAKPEVDAKA